MSRALMDVCFDEQTTTVEEAVAEVSAAVALANPDVAVRLVEVRGPGGGWPVVELSGHPGDVCQVLGDVWHTTLDEALDFLEDE